MAVRERGKDRECTWVSSTALRGTVTSGPALLSAVGSETSQRTGAGSRAAWLIPHLPRGPDPSDRQPPEVTGRLRGPAALFLYFPPMRNLS